MGKWKWYAVARGRTNGLYLKWFGADGAEAQVRGFPGAVYKGFLTREEAQEWFFRMQGIQPVLEKAVETVKNEGEDNETTAVIQEPTSGPTAFQAHDSSAGKVVIHTDGACIGNPGPGGYGVVMLEDGQKKELSGGFKRTTNNRMELISCIEALKGLKCPSVATIYTDSQYVANSIGKGGARKWRENNWMRKDGEKAKNVDLLGQLLDLCDLHRVEFVWVRGHSGDPDNERCDQLAEAMAAQMGLPPDQGFVGKGALSSGPTRP